MRHTNKLFLTLIITLCSLPLSASKEYTVPTGDNNITCKLTTLSRKKMGDLLNPFKPQLPTPTAFDGAIQRYMLIEVEVTNNSSKTIILNKDEYLEEAEFFIAQKKRLLQGLAACGESQSGGVVAAVIIAGGSSILTLVGAVMAMEGNPALGLAFSATGVIGMLGSFAIAAVYDESIAKINEHWEHIRGAAHHYDPENPKKRFRYKQEREQFRVPAGHVFKDLLLVDLQEVKRNFLNDFTPEFLYNFKD